MKKQIILVCAVIFSSFMATAQEAATGGMNFEHLSAWNDVVAKAKKENKLIFLDCYTTWCGPCRMMSTQIFPQKKVGDFYNANFINAKVQLDTTDKDNDYVKGWYKDGHDLAEKYSVRAYPTYLIFNSDGEIIHRFVGSSGADEFIAAGKDILNPDNQYYTQIKKYEQADRSPALLLKLTNIAQNSYDEAGYKKYGTEYLATQSDVYTKDNLGLLYNLTTSSTDKGFTIALNEPEKADKILGAPGTSAKLVRKIILNEELFKQLRKGGDIDFDAYDKTLNEKYPKYAKPVSDFSKMYYYRSKGKWDLFAKFADEVIKGNKNPSSSELNDYAWTTFENVSDKALLEKALGWSKLSVEKSPDPALMDTYANLLYKLERTKEAIEEEKKALAAAGDDAAIYKETLEKMEKGQPTWPQK